jgi:hypothetical protein
MAMKCLLISAAISVVLLTPVAAQSAKPNAAFLQMIAETGCESKYSDDKKADLFATRWRGTPMTVTGEVSLVSSGTVSLKILRTTLTSDIRVKLRDSRDAYDLEKGQRVTLTFKVSDHGGCILSYGGESGSLGIGQS